MEKKNVVTIMDVDFINKTKAEFIEECIIPRIEKEQKCFIVTANPEIVMKTREDENYKRAVQKADYVIPDGVGIIKASKWIKQPLKERIAGYDLVLDLLQYANENGRSCYFLGAKEEVNEKAVNEVKKMYPNVKIAGRHHGFFDLNDQAIVEQVQHADADIVLVALGFPRQEFWIEKNLPNLRKGIVIGVGGTLDGLANVVPRSPDIWIKLDLEWLHRLLRQPTRFKRILKVFEFMFRVMLKKS